MSARSRQRRATRGTSPIGLTCFADR